MPTNSEPQSPDTETVPETSSQDPSWLGPLRKHIQGTIILLGLLGALLAAAYGFISSPYWAKFGSLFHTRKPATIRTNVTATVDARGHWDLSGGDKDIDLDKHDKVPVSCTTTLVQSSDSVQTSISFRCEETADNYTTYSGTRTFPVYTAPDGFSIKSIEHTGKDPASFAATATSRGFHRFTNALQYWNALSYCADTGSKDDSHAVGVTGKLSIVVVLEPVQSTNTVKAR